MQRHDGGSATLRAGESKKQIRTNTIPCTYPLRALQVEDVPRPISDKISGFVVRAGAQRRVVEKPVPRPIPGS